MSTGLHFIENINIDNGAITNLRELLFLTTLQSEAIEKTLTVCPGAANGKRVAAIGDMDLVGELQPGAIAYNATNINAQEKQWTLGEFTVAEEISYKDLKATIARYAMRRKTSIADLTGTDYLDIIVEPALKNALTRMFWRLLWFGDTAAANVSANGNITNGIAAKYFTVCDGLFKRLTQITESQPDKYVEIEANSETTFDTQRTAIRQPGVATAIIDDLIYNADMRLRQASDKMVLTTQSFADALAIDVKRNTGSDLQWQAQFNGLLSATFYNGHQIIALPVWDDMIAAYLSTGTACLCPHRAVYASRSALWAGIASENMLSEIDIWFSKDAQVNRLVVRDEIGTMVWDENLVRYAY